MRSKIPGGLAQLARAPALHAGGQRFDSVILHYYLMLIISRSCIVKGYIVKFYERVRHHF